MAVKARKQGIIVRRNNETVCKVVANEVMDYCTRLRKKSRSGSSSKVPKTLGNDPCTPSTGSPSGSKVAVDEEGRPGSECKREASSSTRLRFILGFGRGLGATTDSRSTAELEAAPGPSKSSGVVEDVDAALCKRGVSSSSRFRFVVGFGRALGADSRSTAEVETEMPLRKHRTSGLRAMTGIPAIITYSLSRTGVT